MKKLAPVVALVAVLALAGCGGHVPAGTSHGTKTAPKSRTVTNGGGSGTSSPGHSCDPSDYAMPCALGAPRLTLAPPTATPLAYGIDFAWSCPNPRGHGFGASYLSPDGSKNWTRGCINWWHSAGAKTVAVWESSATRAQDGFAAGQADARAAAAQAAALGNSSRPIFFAVDFDTSGFGGPASFPTPTVDTILAYFQGVRSVLGNRAGAYGGYSTLRTLFDRKLIGYGWQTYAWSNGRWDSRAKLEQYLNGSAVDYDRALAADYGQWPYVPAPSYPLCFTHRIPAATCNAVKAKIASQERAAASSERAFVARGCPGIASRAAWFAAHVNRPPASKHAYRARALAASRRAYQRNACGTFAQRQAWFTARAAALKAAN